MKILLINISQNWNGRVYLEYPLGLGIIGTILKQDSHDVKIHDMNVSQESITSVVKLFKPDIVGISFLSTSAYTAFEIIKELKKIKKFHLIAGGIHSSIYYEEVLKMGVDIVVIGEAEYTILPLVKILSNTNYSNYHNQDRFKNIKNIAFKKDKLSIYVSDINESVQNLDELPFIERSLYDLEKYSHHSIISSRGCAHRCRFCSSQNILGKRPKVFSINRIVDEIEYLQSKYGNTKLYWADDMFFYTQKERINFCNELIKRNINIDYVIQLRADNINEELVNALKLTGCSKLAIGAESGSNKILKTIKKGITVNQIETAINLVKEADLRIKTWWIIGLPGEYKEQLKSMELIKKTLPNEIAIHTFIPLPGSYFWNNHNDFGIALPKNIEQLEKTYYSIPEYSAFSYLSYSQIVELINYYELELKNLNYIPTDNATTDNKFIYTTPNQKSTFKI